MLYWMDSCIYWKFSNQSKKSSNTTIELCKYIWFQFIVKCEALAQNFFCVFYD
jgi:hypothetical protein